ncbi:MAG: hypothetical protein IKP86_03180 [Anaerolineaceae bacterium]|nr:hypothetical protein [Anaerolineaceae bacterium]
MEVIITHEQSDFDAAGSVLAAWLLDPSRFPVLPKRRNRNLAAFLEDYKNRLPFFSWNTLPKGQISRILITDTQRVTVHPRMTGVQDVIVWEHHPHQHIFPDREENIYENTGACTTFLVEKLREKQDVHPGRIFATLMLMGIYEDTGSLSYGSTTPRDIRAAAWLVENGADLDLMRRYVLQPMTDHQQQGFNLLMQTLETYEIHRKTIVIAAADIRDISDEFSAVAHQMRDMLNPDGVILLLGVKTGIRVICRATTDDIDFGAMMRALNGGGHTRAASGMIPVEYMEAMDVNELLDDAREKVLGMLPGFVKEPPLNLAEKLGSRMAPEQLELIRMAAETAEQLDMPVYIVGGVVRDLLLDHPVMDFDIVVEGDATRLARELRDQYGGKLAVHSRFFTAKWELPEGESLDLISSRAETYAAPGALPTVELSDIDHDLKRRDFTLNTLAIRLDGDHYGELLDRCGGKQDLDEQLIRTLHDRSFIDDPTRMFRAVRFEQRFDFQIESDTLRQMRDQLDGIGGLTGQRIWHELKLYCAEPYPENDFSRIAELGIAGQIHKALVWDGLMEEDLFRFRSAKRAGFWQDLQGVDTETAEKEGPLWIWFSSFPEKTVTQLAERLLLPKKTQRIIEGLSVIRREIPGISRLAASDVTFFLDRFLPETLYCFQLICSEREAALLEKYVLSWRNVRPLTSGDDLLRMGVRPGPEMRELLHGLRAACIDRDLTQAEEADWLKHHMQGEA